MHNIINNSDLVHVKWVAWIRNAPDQEAIIAKRETKAVMRKSHRGSDLGFAKTYCQDTFNKTTCFPLPTWFT